MKDIDYPFHVACLPLSEMSHSSLIRWHLKMSRNQAFRGQIFHGSKHVRGKAYYPVSCHIQVICKSKFSTGAKFLMIYES